jgi:sigma-B regulation protein RsbU (phosphoserine phosphatase)
VKLKKRVFIQTLSTSLAFTLLLSVIFFVCVAKIRNTVLANFSGLGDSAADVGAYALEDQVTDKIARVASDMAAILDEKFIKIENHTRMTADITGSIYTHREAWPPKRLPYVRPGETTPAEPYLHTAPGVDPLRIRAETDLAGNIADVLRQIAVVDRGITTSTIGGESGYIIAMDTFPWPSLDFDPRLYSWYQGARAAGDLFWTGVYLDPRGRGPAISCSAPFYDRSGGKPVFRGVARSTVMLADFPKIIDSVTVGRAGYLFLLDRSGLKLFSSGSVDVKAGADGVIVGENFLESENPRLRSLGKSMTLGAGGMTELVLDGLPVYAAYAPINTVGWSLGVAIPAREISVPAGHIEARIHGLAGETKTVMDRYILLLSGLIALTLLASLCVIALVSVKFTSALTGPILALNEGVHEVGGANLDREVQIKTGDELEELALSFNAMTRRLRGHIAETARVSAERERISTELDVATRIQIGILPGVFPPFPGRRNDFELYAETHPAREVGGDFYDFFFIDDDHIAVVIADVSGKGVPAALFMVIAKTLIKNHVQSGEDPALALENINRQLCDNNIEDMFVTVWLGIIEISSGLLRYINVGHNPPLVKRGGRPFAFLVSPPDLVLGGMDDTLYHCREIALENGDILFCYTDGIPEAAGPGETFYGKERLRAFLDARAELSPRTLLSLLLKDIGEFSGGEEQSDDITMLFFRLNRGDSARSVILKAETGELDTLNAFIGGVMDAAGCPEEVRRQVELAAEEIFVNAVTYAYRDRPGERSFGILAVCGVEKGPAGTVLTLSFADRGTPFNPLEKADPDLTLPLEEREAGGLGVLLVKRMTDSIEYGYIEGMNRLTITKSW